MTKLKWVDDIEAQIDDTVPYYVPHLLSEIRLMQEEIDRLKSVRICPECEAEYVAAAEEQSLDYFNRYIAGDR